MAQEPYVAVGTDEVQKFAVVRPVPRAVKRVMVGYVTKPIDGIDKLVPKPDDAVRWDPNLNTFASVCISTGVDAARFDAAGRGPDGDKPPICKAVRKWLFERFPHSWNTSDKWPEGHVPPVVRFIGFDPTGFLRTLAMECALPVNGCRLPTSMWHYNDEYVDLLHILGPRGPRSVSLKGLILSRKPLEERDAKLWEDLLEGWEAPGVNAEKDHYIGQELAAQLGFLRD